MEHLVGIGEYRFAEPPGVVITRGLGSCVGVVLYDSTRRWGGLAHIMLPDSKEFNNYANPYKFADLAIPALYKELNLKGCTKLQARIAGGAKMFAFTSERPGFDIGARNVLQVKRTLKDLGIPLTSEDVGGSWGRTVILDTQTGVVKVRTVGRGETQL